MCHKRGQSRVPMALKNLRHYGYLNGNDQQTVGFMNLELRRKIWAGREALEAVIAQLALDCQEESIRVKGKEGQGNIQNMHTFR